MTLALVSNGFAATHPLTTIFTPPASCISQWTYEKPFFNSVSGGLLIQNAMSQFPDRRCFPSGFSGFGRVATFNNLYSPAACPVGYTTAGNAYDGATTFATCCLSDYEYLATVSEIAFLSSTAEFRGCISTYSRGSGATVVSARGDSSNLVPTTILGPVTMWAQPISIAYREADLSLFTTVDRIAITPSTSETSTPSPASPAASPASSRTPPSTTSTPNSTIPTTSLTAQASSDSATHSKLSIGVIAGAVVGVAILLGFAITLFIFWRRKRSRSKARAVGRAEVATTPCSSPKHRGFNEAVSSWLPPELESKGHFKGHNVSYEMMASPVMRGQRHDRNRKVAELG